MTAKNLAECMTDWQKEQARADAWISYMHATKAQWTPEQTPEAVYREERERYATGAITLDVFEGKVEALLRIGL